MADVVAISGRIAGHFGDGVWYTSRPQAVAWNGNGASGLWAAHDWLTISAEWARDSDSLRAVGGKIVSYLLYFSRKVAGGSPCLMLL